MAQKELTYVLLDVGPSMHSAFEFAQKALTNFIASKMLGGAKRLREEVELIFYGTTGTLNQLDDEDPGSYPYVTVAEQLRCPDLSTLITLAALSHGQGHADWVDALFVAADSLIKARVKRPELGKSPVRFVLISDLRARAGKVDNLEEMLICLANNLQENKVKLEVVLLDLPLAGGQPSDPAAHADRKFNMQWLERLLEGVAHERRRMREPSDLLSLYRFKEVSPSTIYAGPMSLGKRMHIRVKVAKKVAKEGLPPTGMYSDRSHASDATHGMTRERNVTRPSEPDEEVAPEMRLRAYKYGKNTVPYQDVASGLDYFPGPKALELMGFVEAARIPLHMFTKDPWVILADKGSAPSVPAFSALVQALARLDHVAILRCVPRDGVSKAGYGVTLVAGVPLPAAESHPDVLIANPLPFREDIRDAEFASFDALPPPIPEQLDAMDALIGAMDLGKGEEERLRPEETAHPLLHRFMNHMAALAVDRDARVPAPDEDPWVVTILEPRWDAMPAAPDALAGVAEHFKMTVASKAQQGAEPTADGIAQAGKDEHAADPMAVDGAADSLAFDMAAPQSKVQAVSTSTPAEDFQALLQRGEADKAFEGLQAVILALVDVGLGGRTHDKAMRCLTALRSASVSQARGSTFNQFMQELARRCPPGTLQSGFWQRITGERVTLITDTEAPGVGVDAAAASAFLAQHDGVKQEVVLQKENVQAEEDEFAGMG